MNFLIKNLNKNKIAFLIILIRNLIFSKIKQVTFKPKNKSMQNFLAKNTVTIYEFIIRRCLYETSIYTGVGHNFKDTPWIPKNRIGKSW